MRAHLPIDYRILFESECELGDALRSELHRQDGEIAKLGDLVGRMSALLGKVKLANFETDQDEEEAAKLLKEAKEAIQ
jgi:hypothetical protein